MPRETRRIIKKDQVQSYSQQKPAPLDSMKKSMQGVSGDIQPVEVDGVEYTEEELQRMSKLDKSITIRFDEMHKMDERLKEQLARVNRAEEQLKRLSGQLSGQLDQIRFAPEHMKAIKAEIEKMVGVVLDEAKGKTKQILNPVESYIQQLSGIESNLGKRIEQAEAETRKRIEPYAASVEESIVKARETMEGMVGPMVEEMQRELLQEQKRMQATARQATEEAAKQIPTVQQQMHKMFSGLKEEVEVTVKKIEQRANTSAEQVQARINADVEAAMEKARQQLSPIDKQCLSQMKEYMGQFEARMKNLVEEAEQRIEKSGNTEQGKLDQAGVQVQELLQSIDERVKDVDRVVGEKVAEAKNTINEAGAGIEQRMDHFETSIDQKVEVAKEIVNRAGTEIESRVQTVSTHLNNCAEEITGHGDQTVAQIKQQQQDTFGVCEQRLADFDQSINNRVQTAARNVESILMEREAELKQSIGRVDGTFEQSLKQYETQLDSMINERQSEIQEMISSGQERMDEVLSISQQRLNDAVTHGHGKIDTMLAEGQERCDDKIQTTQQWLKGLDGKVQSLVRDAEQHVDLFITRTGQAVDQAELQMANTREQMDLLANGVSARTAELQHVIAKQQEDQATYHAQALAEYESKCKDIQSQWESQLNEWVDLAQTRVDGMFNPIDARLQAAESEAEKVLEQISESISAGIEEARSEADTITQPVFDQIEQLNIESQSLIRQLNLETETVLTELNTQSEEKLDQLQYQISNTISKAEVDAQQACSPLEKLISNMENHAVTLADCIEQKIDQRIAQARESIREMEGPLAQQIATMREKASDDVQNVLDESHDTLNTLIEQHRVEIVGIQRELSDTLAKERSGAEAHVKTLMEQYETMQDEAMAGCREMVAQVESQCATMGEELKSMKADGIQTIAQLHAEAGDITEATTSQIRNTIQNQIEEHEEQLRSIGQTAMDRMLSVMRKLKAEANAIESSTGESLADMKQRLEAAHHHLAESIEAQMEAVGEGLNELKQVADNELQQATYQAGQIGESLQDQLNTAKDQAAEWQTKFTRNVESYSEELAQVVDGQIQRVDQNARKQIENINEQYEACVNSLHHSLDHEIEATRKAADAILSPLTIQLDQLRDEAETITSSTVQMKLQLQQIHECGEAQAEDLQTRMKNNLSVAKSSMEQVLDAFKQHIVKHTQEAIDKADKLEQPFKDKVDQLQKHAEEVLVQVSNQIDNTLSTAEEHVEQLDEPIHEQLSSLTAKVDETRELVNQQLHSLTTITQNTLCDWDRELNGRLTSAINKARAEADGLNEPLEVKINEGKQWVAEQHQSLDQLTKRAEDNITVVNHDFNTVLHQFKSDADEALTAANERFEGMDNHLNQRLETRLSQVSGDMQNLYGQLADELDTIAQEEQAKCDSQIESFKQTFDIVMQAVSVSIDKELERVEHEGDQLVTKARNQFEQIMSKLSDDADTKLKLSRRDFESAAQSLFDMLQDQYQSVELQTESQIQDIERRFESLQSEWNQRIENLLVDSDEKTSEHQRALADRIQHSIHDVNSQFSDKLEQVREQINTLMVTSEDEFHERIERVHPEAMRVIRETRQALDKQIDEMQDEVQQRLSPMLSKLNDSVESTAAEGRSVISTTQRDLEGIRNKLSALGNINALRNADPVEVISRLPGDLKKAQSLATRLEILCRRAGRIEEVNDPEQGLDIQLKLTDIQAEDQNSEVETPPRRSA